MHTIYHTDAFVLDEMPYGEAGKLFTLFTKELGLIRATAQGVRYEKSKLRFSLSKYAKIHVALVQGKSGWKITNAYGNNHLYHELGDSYEFRIINRTFSLLTRLIQGEEINIDLFDTLEASIDYLIQNNKKVYKKNKDLSRAKSRGSDMNDVECVIVLRILNHLGYVGDHKDMKFFVLDNKLENEHISEMNKNRKLVLSEINRALKESQL